MTQIVRGRLIEPSLVQLDEPIVGVPADAEVIVHGPPVDAVGGKSLEVILMRLLEIPGPGRTREDIAAQIEEERGSWRDDP